MNPIARKEKMTIRELREETLVYDLERHKMHCLNRTAALVWKHCDGRHHAAALAAILGSELLLSAEEAAAAAQLALEQLSRRHLLREAVAPSPEEEHVSRRTALRKIAVAAAAALPLVMTLKSPSIAWAQNTGIPCFGDQDCPSDFICVLGPPAPHNSTPGKGTCVPNATTTPTPTATTTTTTTTTTTSPTTTKAPPCGQLGQACNPGLCCPPLKCNGTVCVHGE